MCYGLPIHVNNMYLIKLLCFFFFLINLHHLKSLEVETLVKIIRDSFSSVTFLNILDAYAYTLAYTRKSVEESVIEIDRCSGRQMSNNLIGFFWGTSEYIHLNWVSVEINSQNHGTKSSFFPLSCIYLFFYFFHRNKRFSVEVDLSWTFTLNQLLTPKCY